MRDDRQRNGRKGFQNPLCCWFVGHLLLVVWGQTGEAGLGLLQRPAPDTLRDCEHTDTERQQGREACKLLVALDKERGDRHTALEAVEEALNAVGVAIAPHRLLPRQPLGPCLGDKSLPAKTLAQGSDAAFLASDLGAVVAGGLDHPLLAVH